MILQEWLLQEWLVSDLRDRKFETILNIIGAGIDGQILFEGKQMQAEMNTKDMPLLAVAVAVFLCVLFGANIVAVKVSLSGIGPFTNAGLRFAVASGVIALWALVTGRPFGLKRGQFRHVLGISALFTIQLSLFYVGLTRTQASRGVLVSNLLPFFVLLWAHFIIPGDRMNIRKFAGIMLGFCGVLFIFLEKTELAAGFRTGDLIVLGSTILWSLNAIYIKRVIEGFEPFHLTLYPMALSVPLFFLTGFWGDSVMISSLRADVLIALGFQSLVTASFGFVAWNTLLQHYGAVALHSYIYIMPVVGVALGGVILGEPVTANIFLALLLITCGIMVVHISPKKFLLSFSSTR